MAAALFTATRPIDEGSSRGDRSRRSASERRRTRESLRQGARCNVSTLIPQDEYCHSLPPKACLFRRKTVHPRGVEPPNSWFVGLDSKIQVPFCTQILRVSKHFSPQAFRPTPRSVHRSGCPYAPQAQRHGFPSERRFALARAFSDAWRFLHRVFVKGDRVILGTDEILERDGDRMFPSHVVNACCGAVFSSLHPRVHRCTFPRSAPPLKTALFSGVGAQARS
jgi:hypothetical protein